MVRALLCFLVILPGMAFAGAPAAGSPVTATHPWFRYLLPQVPAALYVTLENDGDTPAVLTGAASPACGMLMLHKSVENGGTSSMVMVDRVVVPAHGRFAFTPDAYHVMCAQPSMALGQIVPVTLKFADGSTLALAVPVYGPAGPPPAGGAP